MEQKRFDKRNLIVIAVIVLVIAVVGVIAAMQRKQLADVPEDASAWLVITVAGEMYEPIKLEEDGRYTITRGDKVNVIEVTPDSVVMHSSTCDNQDCVLQGVVSLQNRADRVLQNMILCMPNEVVLELYTEEEVAGLLLSMADYTGEEGNE